MGSQQHQIERINQVLGEMYGTDLVNAKRVINTKLSKTRPNPENLTLAERILLNRKKGTQPTAENNRRDTPSGSVDISDLTNQNDERRSPTPEPTNTSRSPVNSPLQTTGAMFNNLKTYERLFDSDLAYLDLNHSAASKLDPAYDEPPFQYLKEVNKIYMPSFEIKESQNLNSTNGFHDNKSDTEADAEKRRPRSAGYRKQTRKHKRRGERNPNELSLAQKLFIYKNVMAFKDSKEQY